jgi:FdhD protein
MSVRQSTSIPITRVKFGVRQAREDVVALEEPLEIQVSVTDGPEDVRSWKTVAITMRTPGQDRELATGFLFGEGLLKSTLDIETVYSAGARYGDNGWQNRVRVALRPGTKFDLSRLERNFYMSSSCGVCGKTSLEALLTSGFQPIPDAGWRIDDRLIQSLPERLRRAQPVFDQTGGLHAAALFSLDGEALLVREDVGRHNAVDKVIGTRVLGGHEQNSSKILVVSGRASFELVQKTVAAGIPMMVAVGAPSSLAVQLAQEFGVTLVGFTKASGFNIYTGAQRVEIGPEIFVSQADGDGRLAAH